MRVTDTVTLDDRDIEERFVRAAGPGGRHVARKATAVELRVDVAASSLPADVKDRLLALAPKLMTTGGLLVVVSRANRSQERNRKAARTRLAALVRRAATGKRNRRPTRPRRAVRKQRAVSKMLRGDLKRLRSRVGRTDD